MASLQSFSKHKRTVRWKKCPSVLGGKALEAGSAEKEPERHHRAFVRDKDKGASSWETFELCKLLLNLSTVGAWLKCPRKGFRTGEGAQICQLYWGIEYSSLWDQIHKNLKKNVGSLVLFLTFYPCYVIETSWRVQRTKPCREGWLQPIQSSKYEEIRP